MNSNKLEGFSNYVIFKNGKIYSCYKHRFIDTDRHYNNGMAQVCLINDEGKRCELCVGPIVLRAFVGPQPEGKECCHRNDNPKHNHIGNLYWGTHSDNMLDRLKNKGKYHSHQYMSIELVREVRELAETTMLGDAGIAEKTGTTRRNVNRIIHGDTFSRIE